MLIMPYSCYFDEGAIDTVCFLKTVPSGACVVYCGIGIYLIVFIPRVLRVFPENGSLSCMCTVLSEIYILEIYIYTSKSVH